MRPWIRFLTRHLVIAAVGTAIIWAGAYLYRSVEARDRLKEIARSVEKQVADLPLPSREEDVPAPASEPATETTSGQEPTPTPGDSGPATDEADAESYAKRARGLIVQGKWDEALRECDAALKLSPEDPGLLALKRKAAARGLQWGVVRRAQTTVFDMKGKGVSSLKAGAVVSVLAIRKTQSEALAVCAKPDTPQSRTTFFVRFADLLLRPGRVTDVKPELRELASRQAILLAEKATLTAQSSGQLNTANPHSKALESARAARKAYWGKVEALKKSFDSASGDDRMKIHDELRGMRGQDIQVEQRYEQAKKDYEAWEAAHPSAPAGNERLQALETELARVSDAIAQHEANP